MKNYFKDWSQSRANKPVEMCVILCFFQIAGCSGRKERSCWPIRNTTSRWLSSSREFQVHGGICCTGNIVLFIVHNGERKPHTYKMLIF